MSRGVAVVTGGSAGLGRAGSRAFVHGADHGASGLFTDREKKWSAQTWVITHRRVTAGPAIAAGVGTGMALMGAAARR